MNIEFDGEKPRFITYYEHEAEMARSELHARRWMVAAVVAFIVFCVSNIGWIIYESQYSDVVMTENTLDGGGVNIMGSGDINYGDQTEEN